MSGIKKLLILIIVIVFCLILGFLADRFAESNDYKADAGNMAATEGMETAADTETENAVEKEDLTDETDTYEWLYKFLNSRDTKLVTEGEYITIKNQLVDREDDLAVLIKNSNENLFSDGVQQDNFFELYYTYLEKNRTAEWLDSHTRQYFNMLESIEIKEDTDIKETILAIDEGNANVTTSEEYKYLVYGLLANTMGYIEEMPYYDAASVLYKLDKCSKDHPELDDVFITLRSKYNGL